MCIYMIHVLNYVLNNAFLYEYMLRSKYGRLVYVCMYVCMYVWPGVDFLERLRVGRNGEESAHGIAQVLDRHSEGILVRQ